MTERRYALRLIRLAGIDVLVHYSWFGIVGLIVLGFWGRFRSEFPDLDRFATAGLSLAGALLFFGSVLLHELAHSLMARRRHIEVRGITLYLFGGATDADPSSRSARDEFAIAIVGPATSLTVAAILGAASPVVGSGDEPLPDLLRYLAIVNLVVAVFNMAPGLPLDGGRVLRSIVWAVSGDFDRATRWATACGVGLGYLLIGIGLGSLWRGALAGLWLVIIGWITSQSALRGESRERWRAAFRGSTAGDVMSTPVVSMPSDTSVANAADSYFGRWDHTVFPVIEGETPVGLLSVGAVRSVPDEVRRDTTVGPLAAMLPPALVADPDTPMLDIVTALSERAESKSRILVLDDGELVGIISPADVVRRSGVGTVAGHRRTGWQP